MSLTVEEIKNLVSQKRPSTAARFHGMPCTHCGTTEKYRKSYCCVRCDREKKRMRRNIIRTTPELWEAHKLVRRARHVQKRFGISAADKEAIFESQGRRCAICLRDENGMNKAWAVDHDHSTNRVRGVLCHKCNAGIGLLRDSAETIARALEYLAKSSLP